jgi:ribonucleoside-diphosphate reductase alpha subunit
MLYKDAVNRNSNQKNLGTIRSSNLCTEIMEFTSANEVAVCNLASIALPRFVKTAEMSIGDETPQKVFDFDKLFHVVRVVTRNLNLVIDRNSYPIDVAKQSNLRHRPIGIGVQGLADTFILMDEPFDGPGARVLNRDIFETIYFGALTESCKLAEEDGPYESYAGSPVSKGKLQFDMWEESGKVDVQELLRDSRWDWNGLRALIKQHGLRNSLLVAPMPTASTAQILGNTECFEPITSNAYVRRVLAGEFSIFNRHLVRRLEAIGLWNNDVRNAIIADNGSVQNVDNIPSDVKRLFKTAWELSQRTLIDLAADRAVFIDQSQSLNLFLAEPTHAKISSMHFYGWKKGLKTGMYYLRTKPAVNALQVTVPVEAVNAATACRRDTPDCEMCSA